MTNFQKVVLGSFIALVVGVTLYLTLTERKPTSVLGGQFTINTSTDSYLNGSGDVVGTHIGTSTVGVAVAANSATTSVVSKIPQGSSKAIYTVKVTSVASTTNNNLNVSVQGSTDYLCETNSPAASSTTDVTIDKINWFDAMTHLTNKVHNTAFVATGTSAILSVSNVVAGQGNTMVLENLNYRCLRFNYSGVSTTIYVGLTSFR